MAGKSWKFQSLSPEAVWPWARWFPSLGFSLLVIYRQYLLRGCSACIGVWSLSSWSLCTEWAFCICGLVDFIIVCQIQTHCTSIEYGCLTLIMKKSLSKITLIFIQKVAKVQFLMERKSHGKSQEKNLILSSY